MGNRIENAQKEYFAKNWNGKEARRKSEGTIEAVMMALEAGFMIGYRKAQRDCSRRRNRGTGEA